MSRPGTWERRRAARWTANAAERPQRIRLIGADHAELLEASRFGALLESWTRLRPGQWVRCAWRTHTAPGRVLRCWVSYLEDGRGVKYRAAVLFEPPMPDAAFVDGPPPSGDAAG